MHVYADGLMVYESELWLKVKCCEEAAAFEIIGIARERGKVPVAPLSEHLGDEMISLNRRMR